MVWIVSPLFTTLSHLQNTGPDFLILGLLRSLRPCLWMEEATWRSLSALLGLRLASQCRGGFRVLPSFCLVEGNFVIPVQCISVRVC